MRWELRIFFRSWALSYFINFIIPLKGLLNVLLVV